MAEQLETFLQERQQVRQGPSRLCALSSCAPAQEDCEKCAYVVPVYEIKSTISNATSQPALINLLNFLNIIRLFLIKSCLYLPPIPMLYLFLNIFFILPFSLLTRPSEGVDVEAKAPLWPNHRRKCDILTD